MPAPSPNKPPPPPLRAVAEFNPERVRQRVLQYMRFGGRNPQPMRVLIVEPTGPDARRDELLIAVGRDRAAISLALKKHEGRFTAPVEGYLRAEPDPEVKGGSRLVFYTQLWSNGEFLRRLRRAGKTPRIFTPLLHARMEPLSRALIRTFQRQEVARRSGARRAAMEVHALRRQLDTLERDAGKLPRTAAEEKRAQAGALARRLTGLEEGLQALFRQGLESAWIAVIERRLKHLKAALLEALRGAPKAPPAPKKQATPPRSRETPPREEPAPKKKSAPKKKKPAPKKASAKPREQPKRVGRSRRAGQKLSVSWAERTLRQYQRDLEAQFRANGTLLPMMIAYEQASGDAKEQARVDLERTARKLAETDERLSHAFRDRDKARDTLSDLRGDLPPQDPGQNDTAPKDTALKDPEPKDTGPKDTGPKEPTPKDPAPKDTGGPSGDTAPEPEDRPDPAEQRRQLQARVSAANKALGPLRTRRKSFERALKPQQQSLESLYRADKALFPLWQAWDSASGASKVEAGRRLDEAAEQAALSDSRLANTLKSRNEYRDKLDGIVSEIERHEADLQEAQEALAALG